MSRKRRFWGWLLGGWAATAGCAPQAEVVPASGRLLVDGAAEAEMMVTFVPDGDSEVPRPISRGVTGADGEFELATEDGRPGAAIGRHRVVIDDLRPFNAPRNDRATEKTPRSRVAIEYGSAKRTPLSAEVSAEGAPITIEASGRR